MATMSAAQREEVPARLAELCETVRGLRLEVEILGSGDDLHLRVGPQEAPLTTIRCQPRPDDSDWLWFMRDGTAGRATIPMAEAHDVIGALVHLKGLAAVQARTRTPR